MIETKERTGYPSIDKPWLKYYSEEAINAPLPECTMYEYIWENNKDHLSDIALRYYGTKITYGKLFDNIQKAASAFYAIGVRAGDIVTIMSMHTPETIYCIYALNYLGAVANMVYMTLAEKEILDTLENTESKLVLVLDAALDKVAAVKEKIGVPIVVLGVSDSMPPHMKLGYRLKAKPKKHSFMTWKGFLARGAAEPPMSRDHAAPAVIVYTSGTTGEPKGVVLSNYGINAVPVQYMNMGMGFNRNNTYLSIIPTFLSYGITVLQLALTAGLDIILWILSEPKAVADAFEKVRPDCFICGPIFLDELMKKDKLSLENLTVFTGGGGEISDEKINELNSFLISHNSATKYAPGYGMSELCATGTENHLFRESSIGIPLPLTNLKIVSITDGNELPAGKEGEICLSSPCAMTEYFKNPDATNEIMEIDDHGCRWIHTGDLGVLDQDGFLYFRGRLKKIYQVKGADGFIYKVFPQRIEELFACSSEVETCGVIVREDSEKMNVPIAFVTLKEGASVGTEQVEEQLLSLAKRELPEHHWPESIHVLDAMPMTPSGKIDYRALEKLAEESII